VKVSRPDLKTGDWVNPSSSLLITHYQLLFSTLAGKCNLMFGVL